MTALDDVSLTVRAGEILGIVGPNGSGKTTLFNVISGFYRPHGGAITLNGRPISGARPSQVSRLGVARTFQHLRLFGNLTVADNMLVSLDRTRTWWSWRYLCWPFGIWRYDRALKRRAADTARRLRPRAVRRDAAGHAALRHPAAARAGQGDRRARRGCCCSTSRPPA